MDKNEMLDTGTPLDRSDYKRWTTGRVISLFLLVGIAAFWIWALSPLAPSGHPDKLDDPEFAINAKVLCGAAIENLETIPLAMTAKDPNERAEQIDAGTRIYRNLLSELLLIAPDEGTRDGELVRMWVADYLIYLDDRDVYAEKFRNGIDEAFTVSKKGRRWVTDPVDEFSKANKMRECLVPLDV
ncbi:MAG: hypothetical protein VYD77_02120 [Actinomycetota bacterium]|nr:hypothetical protein [Actinomycetota bacterium]